MVTNLKEKM